MFHTVKTPLRCILCALLTLNLSGCAVIAVADAAVTVVATGVKITAKGVGAVADVLLPGKTEDK